MITTDDLKAICPYTPRSTLDEFADPLNKAMAEFHISDTIEREAAFLAQVAHESGGFHYVREIASGAAYEGRGDLGNVEPGDGIRYKGRGLIQITGRTNYQRCGEALGIDLITSPELLETPSLACRSAAWFWGAHSLNELADSGNFLLITKRINGGTNGYDDRMAFWERAKTTLAA
jgi:putative chitinase